MRGKGWESSRRPGTATRAPLTCPHSVEEVIEGLNQYVILKDHWPEWDKAHTGTVVFGESLREAVDRVIEVHEGLRSAVEAGAS